MMRHVCMIVAVCLLAIAPLRTEAETVEEGRAAFLASDFDAAYRILQPHAEAGDAEALFMLGLLELGGLGTARDLRSSAERFLSAGDGGMPLAHIAAVLPVFALIDGDLDLPVVGGPNGAASIDDAAGVAFTDRFLAGLSQLTEEDIRDGLVPFLRRMVDAGVPEARVAFAHFVYHQHVPDIPQAEALLLLGSPDPRLSTFWLGFVAQALETQGLPFFLPRSVPLAMAYWHPAAERGVLDAQLRLGQFHREGGDETSVAFQNDLAESLRWYRAAAERGNAEAQYWVGQFYRNAEGLAGVVPRDWAEAVQWYTRAAEQGHAEAMGALYMPYFVGLGVPQDIDRAMDWLKRAAANNHAESQAGRVSEVVEI